MTRRALVNVSVITLVLGAMPAFAAGGRQVEVGERIKGAQRVVVAKAVKVTSRWRTNEHGDKLIVSEVSLQVEETFKGAATNLMSVEIEGGTVDDITLVVSSQQPMRAGERAVIMLDLNASGAHVPHLKGMGILKLDSNNQIQGSNLRLDDIRRLASSTGR